MLVFVAHPSQRVKYILDELLLYRLGIDYTITDSLAYFTKSRTMKIHYGNSIIEGCLNIPCAPLLFEENISEQKIECHKNEKWHTQMYALPYQNIPDFLVQTTYLNFDLFAASFYLLSRYEEYLPSARDEHNRFKPSNSFAFKNNFLEFPLLDHWHQLFAETLIKQYPDILIKRRVFQQINTIDIDFAYKYWGHEFFPLFRKLLGSILKGKPDLKSVVPPKSDPYDTYDFLVQTANNKNIETIFFLLLADYGGNDKNIPPLSNEMKLLVQKLMAKNKIGIHPSYKASLQSKTYFNEHQIFKTLTNYKPKLTRHHFLKAKLPDSYETMVEYELLEDYTMGYASALGFRASTSVPFKLFDLNKDVTLPILVFSPCVMDVTLKNNLGLNPKEAIEKISQIKKDVEKVNGTFISIWHNSSFDPSLGWVDWEQVYESLFE